MHASDGALSRSAISVTPTVTAVNDAPVLSGSGGTLAYTENDGPKVIDAELTITDEDDANIASATITISSGFQSSEDVLAFTDTNDINGSWNQSTGVLTLSGSATKANYEAALESVTYNNTSENPNTTDRTISWQINDGTDNSSAVTSTISLASVNDAPISSGALTNTQANEAGINSNGSLQAGVNANGSAAALMANITDVDGNSFTISQGKKSTSGTFANVPSSSTSTNGLTIAGLYGSLKVGADGSYVYTVDQSNASVDALREDQSLTDSFTLLVSDEAGGSVEQTLNLTIDGTNDPPNLKSSISDSPIEYGRITNLNHNWQDITLSSSFVDPVVIAGDMSYRGGDASVARVRAHPDDAGKISNRFQIKLVESSEHDGPHTTEIISYLVVESGSGVLPDGTLFSAGKTTLTAYESFVSVSIPNWARQSNSIDSIANQCQ